MKQGEHTRSNIIKAANKLFYQQGFHKTSFSDIVKEVGLSKGNITYHFKSKDDILHAVFKQRIESTQDALLSLEKKHPGASSRIDGFIESILKGKNEITRYGCKNGTLAYELGKSDDRTRDLSQQIFNLVKSWLTTQFLALGFSTEQSESLAMELLIRGQGICVFSQVFNDEKLFETEINKLKTLITQQ